MLWKPLRDSLDFTSLGLTTFFLADPPALMGEPSRPRPTLLWLYFTSREVRSVVYTGFIGRIVVEMMGRRELAFGHLHPLISTSKPLALGAIGLLTCSVLSIWIPNLVSIWTRWQRQKKEPGTWNFFATDNTGWLGVWWMGMGDGEWFAFAGHSNEEKSILPAAFLDQMAAKHAAHPHKQDSSPGIVEVDEPSS